MQPMIPVSPELVAVLVGIVLVGFLLLITAVAGVLYYRSRSESIPAYVDSLVAKRRRRIAIDAFLADAIEENDVAENP